MHSRNSLIDIIANIGKYVVIIILVLFFISKARHFYHLGYEIFAQEARDTAGQGSTVMVEITDGMSVKEVARLLKKSGLIRDAGIFVYQEKFSSYHNKIKSGSYSLSSEMKPEEMMKILSGNGSTASSAEEASSGSSAR